MLISQVYDFAHRHMDDDIQFTQGPSPTSSGATSLPTASDIGGPRFSLDYTYVLERGPTVIRKPPIK